MLLTGSDLFTTRHIGSSTACVNGVRLATCSAGKFFDSTGATLRAAAVPSSSVVPSGSARATVTAARTPPAPGRLSTTTGSFVAAVKASPTAWATTSPAPPAASGVMILTGRVGQSCACARNAGTDSDSIATTPIQIALRFRFIRSPRSFLHVFRHSHDRRVIVVRAVRPHDERESVERQAHLLDPLVKRGSGEPGFAGAASALSRLAVGLP